MNRRYVIALLVAAFATTTTASLAAQKPAARAKPKANAAKLGSIGTSQLPGEWCDLGKSYTLGKSEPLNVAVRSLEYTNRRIKTRSGYLWPDAGDKFLVVHYTVQNPLSHEQRVGQGSIDWTAVDAKGQDRIEKEGGVEGTGEDFNQILKPGQKVDSFAIIPVSAAGVVPKLMAAHHADPGALVARFDLHDKVKPLSGAYADPSDKTGATLLQEVPGTVGNVYSIGNYDIKVDSVDFTTDAVTDEQLANGTEFAVVTLECTNYSGGQSVVSYGYADLRDADGGKYSCGRGYIAASSNRRIELAPKTGETAKYRLAYVVPKGVGLKNLTMRDVYGGSVAIDLSSYKTP